MKLKFVCIAILMTQLLKCVDLQSQTEEPNFQVIQQIVSPFGSYLGNVLVDFHVLGTSHF